MNTIPAPALPSASLAGLAPEGRRLVERAHEYAAPLYAGRTLSTGEDAAGHALGMLESIALLNLDADARAAALLYAVPNYLDASDEKLKTEFNPMVASLVAGIYALNALRVVVRERDSKALKSPGRSSQIEILRKMFLAMVEDVRVVLLRLASRVQSLRFYARRANDAQREEIARETLDLYAPLANRLGVWQLKWELEDLSFRFLQPDTYKRIARQIDERRGEREGYIDQAMRRLAQELTSAGVKAELAGRPKHIYSIWNKMQTKHLAFEELYDVRGLRVLVDEVKDCYTALGVVHNLWQPIPKEFDDYISRPKGNYYRSLHTAVMGDDGRALEVQIRTQEMHRYAELGVAAHWRYKEGASGKAKNAAGGKNAAGSHAAGEAFEEKIAMLRQMLAWRDEVVDSSDWVGETKRAALDDTVYVLTPQGQVIDLPRGSTPVDFAYSVHTGLGHRCRGAKVSGAIVSLDYKLKNGERVEIITASARATGAAAGPSRDWLNPALGFIASSRARNKVRQWFNVQELGETIAAGRAALEKELQRESRTSLKHDDVAQALDFERAEDLYAALGREEISSRQLQAVLRPEASTSGAKEIADADISFPANDARRAKSSKGDGSVLVVGVDRLLTQLARCCKPAPPDAITGFVTRGRGISVHRSACASLKHLATRNPERLLPAAWSAKLDGEAAFQVDVAVRANDRQGLLRDIMDALARERVGVAGSQSYRRDGAATHFFTVNVASLKDLRRTLAVMANVPGVVSATRR